MAGGTDDEGVREGFQDRAGVLGVDTDQSRQHPVEAAEVLDPADDEVVNFCKDCQLVVGLLRRRRRNHCATCDGREIFIGTKRGIKHHFRLKKLDYATAK